MKYSNGIVTNRYGMIVGEAEGINMADISMISEGSIKTGDSLSNAPPTTNSKLFCYGSATNIRLRSWKDINFFEDGLFSIFSIINQCNGYQSSHKLTYPQDDPEYWSIFLHTNKCKYIRSVCVELGSIFSSSIYSLVCSNDYH